MGRLGKGPLDAEIIAEADEKDALAALGNAEIGGVENARDDVVMKPVDGAVSVVTLKPGEVIAPILSGLPDQLRIGELQADILKIVLEGLPGQSL